MKEEYKSEGKIIFVVSENEVFISMDTIMKDIIKPQKFYYQGGMLGYSKGYFIKDNINVEIEYADWFGTELKITEDLENEKIDKVRNWVRIIKENIGKQG